MPAPLDEPFTAVLELCASQPLVKAVRCHLPEHCHLTATHLTRTAVVVTVAATPEQAADIAWMMHNALTAQGFVVCVHPEPARQLGHASPGWEDQEAQHSGASHPGQHQRHRWPENACPYSGKAQGQGTRIGPASPPPDARVRIVPGDITSEDE